MFRRAVYCTSGLAVAACAPLNVFSSLELCSGVRCSEKLSGVASQCELRRIGSGKCLEVNFGENYTSLSALFEDVSKCLGRVL
jgi:hypothetical protein